MEKSIANVQKRNNKDGIYLFLSEVCNKSAML